MNFRKEPNETRTCSTAASEEGIPVLPLEQCLAKTQDDDKPGCTVLEHLVWVGKIAEALWERLAPGVKDLLPKNVVVTLAALHDIGKISPGFQRKIWNHIDQNQLPGNVDELLIFEDGDFFDDGESADHAFLGEIILQEKLGLWAKVIGRHHGGNYCYWRQEYESDMYTFGGTTWQSLRLEVIQRILSFFKISLNDLSEDASPAEDILYLTTGFVVVADWLGSDERFYIDGKIPADVVASEYAGKILDEIGWTEPKLLANKSFDELFRNVGIQSELKPNETQQAFYDVAKEPGVYVIEAPTGLGKTEAALYGAYRLAHKGNSGLYFALPTRMTSDKIYERVEPFIKYAFAENFSVRLAHSLAWTRSIKIRSKNKKFESGDRKNFCVGDDWFRPSKRALLQTFGVGTIDQSLMGVLPVKHNFLRLFGLAGKVVIFDEAHSYDRYTGALLDRLIQNLENTGSSVIVLSATLTRERRARLLGQPVSETTEQEVEEVSKEEYPLISYRYFSDKSKQISVVSRIPAPPDRVVELEAIERNPNRVAEMAVEYAEQGMLVLYVTNTVDKAQALYKLILAVNTRVSAERIGLLHSRFPSVVRENVEDRFLNMFGKNGDRSQGSILVSTQVVEQSVDIDADLLITDLAPTDMLIQRIGRLWRHKRENRPVSTARAFVVYPPEGKESFKERLGADGYVYQPYVLWRTAEVWRSRTQISIPGDVRKLIESTYAVREESGEARTMKEDIVKIMESMESEANLKTSGSLPNISDKNACLTRYGEQETLDVLIVRSFQIEPPSVTLWYGETIDLCGETIKLDKYRRLSDAVSLCRNTVSRRIRNSDEDLIKELQNIKLYKALVKTYFQYSKHFVVLQWNKTTGELRTLRDDPTDLMYREDLGIFNKRTLTNQNKNEGTVTVEYQEEEIGEGADDGNYDDFEW